MLRQVSVDFIAATNSITDKICHLRPQLVTIRLNIKIPSRLSPMYYFSTVPFCGHRSSPFFGIFKSIVRSGKRKACGESFFTKFLGLKKATFFYHSILEVLALYLRYWNVALREGSGRTKTTKSFIEIGLSCYSNNDIY